MSPSIVRMESTIAVQAAATAAVPPTGPSLSHSDPQVNTASEKGREAGLGKIYWRLLLLYPLDRTPGVPLG